MEVGDARRHLGMAVQVIEELMSIADGQVVLRRDGATGMVSVDPQASISRIGSRAYPPALADLAVQLRFELAQVGPPLLGRVYGQAHLHLAWLAVAIAATLGQLILTGWGKSRHRLGELESQGARARVVVLRRMLCRRTTPGA